MAEKTMTVKVEVDANGAIRRIRDINGRFLKMGTNAGVAQKGISGIGSTAKLALGGLAVGAILAVAAALKELAIGAIATGGSFEQAMANVGAVSGASVNQLEQLTATARELGGNTAFSAVEAAEGMKFLAQAGFDTNEIMSTMPGLLDVAAASATDLGLTADVVSNVLSGFGLSTKETARVSDVLTKAFTSSNTTLGTLGEAMKVVAPVAVDLGIEIEDVAAAIGRMGDAGISGSLAGTQLRGALLQIVKGAGPAGKEMEDLGIQIDDGAGKMKSIPEIIETFNFALKDLTQVERSASLARIVGQESISGFSALLRIGSDDLREYGDELRNSTGTAAEVAARQLDTYQGSMRLLSSAYDELKIKIFDLFGDGLRDSVDSSTKLIQDHADDIIAAFRFIGENSATAFQLIVAAIKLVVNNSSTLLFNFIQLIKKTILELPATVVEDIRLAVRIIDRFGEYLMNVIPLWAEQMGNVGSAFWHSLLGNEKEYEQTMKDIVSNTEDASKEMYNLLSDVGSGLGNAMAERFLEASEVMLNGIDLSELKKIIEQFKSLGDFVVDPPAPASPPDPKKYVPDPNAIIELMETAQIGIQDSVSQTTIHIEDNVLRQMKADAKLADQIGKNAKRKLATIEREKAAAKSLQDAREQAVKSQILGAGAEIKSANDAANAFVAASKTIILAKLAETIAKSLAALGPLAPFLGAGVGIGLSALFTKVLPKFHTGGLALQSDEFPAILQHGEMVIKTSSVQSIGVPKLDYINRTGRLPEQNINLRISGSLHGDGSTLSAVINESVRIDNR